MSEEASGGLSESAINEEYKQFGKQRKRGETNELYTVLCHCVEYGYKSLIENVNY